MSVLSHDQNNENKTGKLGGRGYKVSANNNFVEKKWEDTTDPTEVRLQLKSKPVKNTTCDWKYIPNIQESHRKYVLLIHMLFLLYRGRSQ